MLEHDDVAQGTPSAHLYLRQKAAQDFSAPPKSHHARLKRYANENTAKRETVTWLNDSKNSQRGIPVGAGDRKISSVQSSKHVKQDRATEDLQEGVSKFGE